SNGRGGGVIQGTASEAVLVAMCAARAAAERRGGERGGLVAYCSSQAHSSVTKAAMIAGIGRDAVRVVDVDDRLAMRAEALREAIREDRAAGRAPLFVCATLGTTSSGAVDPLDGIAVIAREEGAWLHVDAAWLGAAFVCPELRGPLAGVERADSFNFNPHKWLLTNFDCSALWVADRAPLLEALSIMPEYLRNAASDANAVIDYRDWQIPLGRRFRALKLWFVIRHYGVEGLRAHIRASIAMAERFEALVRADERFEIAAPRSAALVCFRLRGEDGLSRRLVEAINASGRAFITHTALPDPERPGESRYVIRFAIGGVNTRPEHIEETWGEMQRAADAIAPRG
ncbi:MAG: aminotransferase class V-fold PLP-dependent enzyme, partial [Planctomycetota bacterium]|nr:aminotransferase class V-fold PLP-dependent enzyme [Planctomycetota bacterium]